MTKKKIVVLGFAGSCPIAGVIWQHIHYIVGLQELGHEVYYVENSSRPTYNPVTFQIGVETIYAEQTLRTMAQRFGFEERWSFCPRFLANFDERTVGIPLSRVRDVYRDADVLLNLCGAQEIHDDLADNDRIVYVESDPGVEQIKVDQGLAETRQYLDRHSHLFTFGENISTDEFPVPLHGMKWLSTRQPVVTDLWYCPELPPPVACFTTVANWSTSGKKDIEWRGENYLWSKSQEFKKFAAAPMLAGEMFEMASDIQSEAERNLFLQHGWKLISPHPLSIGCGSYRNYIRRSKGEFSVAKDQYVRLNTGWFSDRTACYLAAGRPAIVQETGFSRIFGNSGGLFSFTNLEEIRDAVREINSDYSKHSALAHEIACEFFEARKVVSSLLERAGV